LPAGLGILRARKIRLFVSNAKGPDNPTSRGEWFAVLCLGEGRK
jgi:hypothetical protein